MVDFLDKCFANLICLVLRKKCLNKLLCILCRSFSASQLLSHQVQQFWYDEEVFDFGNTKAEDTIVLERSDFCFCSKVPINNAININCIQFFIRTF